MGFLSKFQARKELNRLEDRYVKRANRNVWRSDAEYVNGEYIYSCRQEVQPPVSRSQTKTTTSSSRGSSTSRPSTHSSATTSDSSKTTTSSKSSRDSKRASSFPWAHMR